MRSTLLSPFSRRCPGFMSRFTWGEILLLVPFTVAMTFTALTAANAGAVKRTGKIANILVFLVLMLICRKASPCGFMLGIPFERALWYHKFFAYLAIVLGSMHGGVAFQRGGCYGRRRRRRVKVCESWSTDYLLSDDEAITGLLYLGAFLLLALTSLPPVRRWLFEWFYVSHLTLFVLALGFAALHGAGEISVAAAVWAADSALRYGYLAAVKHTQTAIAEALPGAVIRLTFNQTDFKYYGGQYLLLCLPDVSLFEWHPFSISSSPHQEHIQVHIRALGNWTRALHQHVLQAGGKTEMKIFWEGPHGSPECDIWGKQYRTFLLISGGIGITPLQSVTNQLLEQGARGRPITQIRFVWSVCDRDLVNAMYDPKSSGGLPTRLPMAFQPDLIEAEDLDPSRHEQLKLEFYLTRAAEKSNLDDQVGDSVDEEDKAATETLIITSSPCACEEPDVLPHVRHGRPQLRQIFNEVKAVGCAAGESRIAVMVCGPEGLSNAVAQLCDDLSDDVLRFDRSVERFEF